MQDELRIYSVKPGAMTDWVAEWTRLVRPLRLKYGFEVTGPWIDEEQNQFIWILRYHGSGTYEAANTAYYESPERKALNPDPARHLAKTENRPIRPVT
mgnify:CR=1 FL=1